MDADKCYPASKPISGFLQGIRLLRRHQEAVRLPAYRVIVNDDQPTRYYIDPISGALLKKVDGAGRGYRWLHEGLHRWDFTSTLRARPLWDFLMLGLMVGVTAVCGMGAFVAYRRYFPARRESK